MFTSIAISPLSHRTRLSKNWRFFMDNQDFDIAGCFLKKCLDEILQPGPQNIFLSERLLSPSYFTKFCFVNCKKYNVEQRMIYYPCYCLAGVSLAVILRSKCWSKKVLIFHAKIINHLERLHQCICENERPQTIHLF